MQSKLNLIFRGVILFALSSCLNQAKAPKIPGVDGPNFGVQNGKILLTVGLENVEVPGGLTLPIPKLPNSTATFSPRLEGGSIIQIAFDLKDVESDHFKVVPHETLPDGRPFPFTIDGTLPALAINVPKLFDTTFYGSQKVFGFFLPIKLPPEFKIDIHYRLKVNNKNIGIVSLIHPNQQGEGAGVILLLTLDQIRSNPDFQKLLKHSKKYKSKVF